ncbi:MAG: tetratricopeptide repeat protein, partial [Cyanobacteriota bacterium]
PYRARSQAWIGLLLSAVGRRQEALAPTEEALKIYRGLAQSNPAFQGDLANALYNLAIRYSELGRRQEALAPVEEALKIYRGLAQSNPAFQGDLANALNNLGIWYSELGRRQEALAPAEEALKIYRGLAQSNPAFLDELALSLNALGTLKNNLGQPEQARAAYEESLTIIRPLAAANPAFQGDLQRFLYNLDNFNRQEGLRTGERKLVAASDLSFLPKDDPNTPIRRAVVRLWPTFAGKNSGIGQLGTGFVVKRQGDRAWIATAKHVIHDVANDYALAVRLEAELYTGPLPNGLEPTRLEVILPPQGSPPDQDVDVIILEVRGLPADVRPLELTMAPPQGALKVVGHPSDKLPWTVAPFAVLKTTDQQLVLDGQLLPGASGSPVLNASGQVLGLVYETGTYAKQSLNLVSAYRSSAIQSKLP